VRNRPKSATGLPSWDSDSRTDGSMEKRKGTLTVQKSCLHSEPYKNLVNFGPLTLEFTLMVWRPFMCQMGEIDETRSILGTRIPQWMTGTAERICAKFTWKTCLVLRLDDFECQGEKSKVKVTRDKKHAVHSQHLHCMDGMERPHCR